MKKAARVVKQAQAVRQPQVGRQAQVVRQAQVGLRLQELTWELERLVPELKAAVSAGELGSALLSPAAKSLERVAAAITGVVAQAKPGPIAGVDARAILEGTSPILSMLGSRVILANVGSGAPKAPSMGAQALAMLLEDPKRVVSAAEVAERLSCTEPIARTTLNRLVQSGHATRPSAGRFRAKSR